MFLTKSTTISRCKIFHQSFHLFVILKNKTPLSSTFVTAIIAIFTFSVGFVVATVFPPNVSREIFVDGAGTSLISWTPNLEKELPLGPLNEAYEQIKKNYYWFSTYQKDQLVGGMIGGLVDSLQDPHSVYFDEEETRQFDETIRWNFEGIWAYVGKTQSGVLIRQTFENSPAREAGLLEWDILTSVNNESIIDLDIEDAIKKIRWPAGSSVTLSGFRPSEKNEPFEKKVIRRSVVVPSVVSKMLDNKIGLITVGIFGQTTPEEFLRAYTELSGSGMNALIVDLRDNPGGLLVSGLSLLNTFIPPGELLVETKWSSSDRNEKFFSEGPGIQKMPVVVLINENSASASEIFAGAIQDYDRWVVVGVKSYGKWSVQETFSVGNGGEIKITVARWYTPKGKWIDKVGITPDIESVIEPEDYEKKYDRVLEKGKEVAKSLFEGKTVQELKATP